MTIASISSQLEEKEKDMENIISGVFNVEKGMMKSDLLNQTTTFVDARLPKTDLDLNQAIYIAKTNFQ